MTWLLVVVGAVAGAPARFLVDRVARETSRAGTILGTLEVNVAGSFVLGVLAGWKGLPSWALLLGGVGFCGAFTTFSTLAFETWVFFEERAWRPFAANLALSLGLGLAAVYAGFWLGGALS